MSSQDAIIKFNLGPLMAKAFVNPSESLTELHAMIVAKRAEVEAIEKQAAGKKNDGPNALETKYEKDEAGKKAAESFLRAKDGVLQSIVDYIGEDAGRTYHMHEALKSLLMPYVRTEVAYFVMDATPKTVSVSRKAEYKKDTNDLRLAMSSLAGIVSSSAHPEGMLAWNEKTQVWDSTVAPFRKQAAKGSEVTGRYAKIYRLSWNIDGEDIPGGTNIPTIVRYLWSGIDRIGKNATNLTDILDKQSKWNEATFSQSTFTVNGHKVTVSTSSDEDMSDDDDSEEADAETE